MKTFSASFGDYIAYNRKSNEDFFLASENIFVLADGVTQSRFFSGEYAYPEGAKTAAKIFCFEVLKSLERESNLHKAFDKANEKIKELNDIEGMSSRLDYLVFDYFDAVGIAGFLKGNTLHYGFVGDCGLAVFDKDNKLKFQTQDMVEPARINAREKYENWNNLSANDRTIIMHQEFRNSPQGYGSFTGEKGVKEHYQIGQIELLKGDLSVFYSDGFVEYFQFPEFLEILRKEDKKGLEALTLSKARENSEKFGHDRTIISFAC